jgi:hypothetical protein
MSANTGLVTRQMKEDFDACMVVVLPAQPEELDSFKQDLREVSAEYGQDYAAQWIAGWRQELEANGPTGHTGMEIERRGLRSKP